MKLYTDDLTKRVINNKELNLFKKTKNEEIIETKVTILSMVYGSTLSSADVAELGDILITISQYIADKENEVR